MIEKEKKERREERINYIINRYEHPYDREITENTEEEEIEIKGKKIIEKEEM